MNHEFRIPCREQDGRLRSSFEVACIGSRDLHRPQLLLCAQIGAHLVQRGAMVRTGNAIGADQAYADGANRLGGIPQLVTLVLPWAGYEAARKAAGNVVEVFDKLPVNDRLRLMDEAREHHPAWDRCTQGARKLHARNGRILDGAGLVIAWPRGADGGGTGQGMRVARARGIEVIDLSQVVGLVGMDWLDEALRRNGAFAERARDW